MAELIDTCIFLRVMAGDRLPPLVERAIEDDSAPCFVSIVSIWEIVMKPRLGLDAADVEEGIAAMGANLLPIRIPHLTELAALPAFEIHRDPFDRLLIAQAISENMRIVSSDSRFPLYKKLRLLWD